MYGKRCLAGTPLAVQVASFKNAHRGTGFDTVGERNSPQCQREKGRAGVLVARNNRCAELLAVACALEALIHHLNHHHYRYHHHSALTELRKIPHGFLSHPRSQSARTLQAGALQLITGQETRCVSLSWWLVCI